MTEDEEADFVMNLLVVINIEISFAVSVLQV